MPIVQPGAFQRAVGYVKAERFDKVHRAPGRRRRPHDVAGILRYLRLHQNDIEHLSLSHMRFFAYYTTRPLESKV